MLKRRSSLEPIKNLGGSDQKNSLRQPNDYSCLAVVLNSIYVDSSVYLCAIAVQIVVVVVYTKCIKAREGDRELIVESILNRG